MTSKESLRLRTRLAVATGGPIVAILVLAFTGNIGVKYNDMTALKNLITVPIVLSGFIVALMAGCCFALPTRGQPARAILGGGLSLAVLGLAFYLSRQV